MATEQTIELKEKPAPDGRARVVTKFEVHGMTCGNCARHVTEAIQSVQGVQSATVSLDAHEASVRWAPDAQPDTAAVERRVKAAGYVAKVHPHDQSENKLANWQITLWIGVIGTALMMSGEWVFGLAMERWFQWFSLIIASVVQVFAGAPFYRGAWRQLKAGSSNMDTLVALGSSAAFAYSTWALLSGTRGHVYFMEAASIIALISVGHWMEARVSVRASSALQRLLNLAPAIAHRRNADGTASEVPVAELKPGDLAGLRPGDRVPTDGEVVEGDSAVDESMLTGESNPVDKTARSQLYAGTVNLNGVLIMRVTAVGEETALAHIIEAVHRAQTSRANIQRLGDRVSSIFVPAVVAVALAAALWWGLAPESANHIHTWLAQFLYRVSLRDGPGHPGRNHGGLKCGSTTRHFDP
jgi:Cu+-exporting ATPase